jgi:ribosomal protein S18 acetylase RimI-like enzyme
MEEGRYTIRTMTRGEVDTAVEWAAIEGWNPGLNDAECYFEADPAGFFIGLLDGAPIATLSAVRYGKSFGFMGFYIVRPDCRGEGYGTKIWNAGLEYLEGRIIGLDGVVDQQENYRKSGFRLAHRNVRYEGAGGGGAPEGADIVELAELPFEAGIPRPGHTAGRRTQGLRRHAALPLRLQDRPPLRRRPGPGRFSLSRPGIQDRPVRSRLSRCA